MNMSMNAIMKNLYSTNLSNFTVFSHIKHSLYQKSLLWHLRVSELFYGLYGKTHEYYKLYQRMKNAKQQEDEDFEL